MAMTTIMGIPLLVAATILCILSSASYHWTELPGDVQPAAIIVAHRGLWDICIIGRGCTPIEFKNKFNLRGIFTEWTTAVQTMFTLGVVGCVMSCVLCIMMFICQSMKGSYTANQTLAGIILISCLLLTTSTVVFGIMAYKSQMAVDLPGAVRLSWSFELAIVACACSFFAGIMYLCEGCNILESRREYTKLPGSA